jgi:hypothetical protein
LGSFRICSQIIGNSRVASRPLPQFSDVQNLRAPGFWRFCTRHVRQDPNLSVGCWKPRDPSVGGVSNNRQRSGRVGATHRFAPQRGLPRVAPILLVWSENLCTMGQERFSYLVIRQHGRCRGGNHAAGSTLVVQPCSKSGGKPPHDRVSEVSYLPTFPRMVGWLGAAIVLIRRGWDERAERTQRPDFRI